MGIKRSTLYYQPKKNINKKQKELRIRKKIEDISREYPYYGYRRITASLRRDRVIVNHKKVLKMMKELGIQGRIKRKYKSYPMQDEPESKSHAASILSNNLSLSNCTFLAISLSVYLLAILSNLSRVILSLRYIRTPGILLNFS